MNGIAKDIFERIVKRGVYMVLDGGNLMLTVACLSRTNGLDPKQALRLKERITQELKA